MQPSTAVEIRLLFESDIPAAMQLKEVAGWNQTEEDWRRLLMLEPNGCFGAIRDGRLVGTTTTTTYGKELAWIGMVLVDPQYRRLGIAAKLMSVALDYLKDKVDTIKLDATALGKPVYEKFGFEVESTVERWTGTANSEARGTKTLTFEDRDALLELDRLAFDADRSKLIERLIDKSPVSPVLLRAADDALNGYALARRGTRADYVGPVVSRDPQQAETLLDQVLSQLNGRPVYIDFNKECGIGTSMLAERGFTKERDLIRMRARGPALKTSPFVVGIAGPEVG
ncbi:MAG TPA: GNAT family N-acetyltransferase [Pyrinomonadaceae bacterium]